MDRRSEVEAQNQRAHQQQRTRRDGYPLDAETKSTPGRKRTPTRIRKEEPR